MVYGTKSQKAKKKKTHLSEVHVTAKIAAHGDVEVSVEAERPPPGVANNVVTRRRRPVVSDNHRGVVQVGLAVVLDHSTEIVLPARAVDGHGQRAERVEQGDDLVLLVHEAVAGVVGLDKHP